MKNLAWTNNKTDLALYIYKVYHESDDYIKVSGMLYNKSNKIVYETKNYKLDKNRIKDWFPIES